jgi:hypothetical protein
MKAGFGFAVGGAVFGAVIFVGASAVAYLVVHH